ncbi:MAG TPA: hypothetical protein VG367_14980 [Mucilaginibacter sp.]|jgi:hypothetical protein|nr:hypothetical protein [Mucilaginibacter sp.]
MKKFLFGVLVLLTPALTFAQTQQQLLKDFEKNTRGVKNTFQLNDQVNIMTIRLDNEFELLAIDNKMQVLWRNTFKGDAVISGKFKGHILAIGANVGDPKTYFDSYTGYLIDEQTGKLLLQKLIYMSTASTVEVADAFFAEDGSYLKLALRQTGAKKTHSRFSLLDKIDETRGITVIDVNDKLEATVSVLEIPNGFYTGLQANKAGDVFTFFLQNDKTLIVSKFENGKTKPSAAITQNVDMPEQTKTDEITYGSACSSMDPNVAYFGLMHKNPSKDLELTVCKVDFTANSGKIVNEILTKSHVKTIEKSFIPPDKIDKAYIGSEYFFVLKHMWEYDGTLSVVYGGKYQEGNGYWIENSAIINGYDKDLNQSFQQVLPNRTTFALTSHATAGFYHNSNNNLCVVVNTGNMTFDTMFGQLDLATGKWVKLKMLEKKKITSSDFTPPTDLWYKDSFILIYQPFTHGLDAKVDLDLQLNSF